MKLTVELKLNNKLTVELTGTYTLEELSVGMLSDFYAKNIKIVEGTLMDLVTWCDEQVEVWITLEEKALQQYESTL